MVLREPRWLRTSHLGTFKEFVPVSRYQGQAMRAHARFSRTRMQQARNGQVRQREACHVEDGDVVGGSFDSRLAAQQVAQFDAWRVGRPLRFADLLRLRCDRRRTAARVATGLREARACRGCRRRLQFRCVPGRTASRSKRAPPPGVAVITMSLWATAALLVAGRRDVAAAGEVGLERRIALAVRTYIKNLAQRWHQAQREVELDARLHAGAEDAQPRAVGPCKLLEAEPARRARAHCRHRVAVDDA